MHSIDNATDPTVDHELASVIVILHLWHAQKAFLWHAKVNTVHDYGVILDHEIDLCRPSEECMSNVLLPSAPDLH